ncbi:hypothetical protein JKP88DRAFT_260991 [Tribonema minus]|uniref:Uncharacterized protein n=1 Tax=Tribonema minus TaxID=303371 RepID=A0A836CIE9_9STRA|nr:hypothetical protein JKP88DRAFT_260991 [Tribonema minus]
MSDLDQTLTTESLATLGKRACERAEDEHTQAGLQYDKDMAEWRALPAKKKQCSPRSVFMSVMQQPGKVVEPRKPCPPNATTVFARAVTDAIMEREDATLLGDVLGDENECRFGEALDEVLGALANDEKDGKSTWIPAALYDKLQKAAGAFKKLPMIAAFTPFASAVRTTSTADPFPLHTTTRSRAMLRALVAQSQSSPVIVTFTLFTFSMIQDGYDFVKSNLGATIPMTFEDGTKGTCRVIKSGLSRAQFKQLSETACKRTPPAAAPDHVKESFVSGVFDTDEHYEKFVNGDMFFIVNNESTQLILVSRLPIAEFKVAKVMQKHGLPTNINIVEATKWLQKASPLSITTPNSARQWLWVEGVCKKRGVLQARVYDRIMFILQHAYAVNLILEIDSSMLKDYDINGNYIEDKQMRAEHSAQATQVQKLQKLYSEDLNFSTGVQVTAGNTQGRQWGVFTCKGPIGSVLMYRLYDNRGDGGGAYDSSSSSGSETESDAEDEDAQRGGKRPRSPSPSPRRSPSPSPRRSPSPSPARRGKVPIMPGRGKGPILSGRGKSPQNGGGSANRSPRNKGGSGRKSPRNTGTGAGFAIDRVC